MRAGFEVYFRKRLFELVEGRLFYRFEDVLIDEISQLPATTFIRNDARYDATRQEIERSISKVGLTLSRDTRDSILFPSEGSIVSIRKNSQEASLVETQTMAGSSCRGLDFIKPLMQWTKSSQSSAGLEHWVDSMVMTRMFPFLRNSFLAVHTILGVGLSRGRATDIRGAYRREFLFICRS